MTPRPVAATGGADTKAGRGTMKPYYYQDDHATIYHGDCREILPGLSFDCIVTDPPYGMKLKTDYSRLKGTARFNSTKGHYAGKSYATVHGDDMPFDPSWLIELSVPTVLFGADNYASKLPDSRGWIVWDKREELGANMFSDCELAWTNKPTPSRIFRHKWLGYHRASEVGNHLHPTQKPVVLMRWVVNFISSPGDVVADPFMGSGPIPRAAKDLGRRSIGIEIEERYCEIAANRLAQEVLDFGGAP